MIMTLFNDICIFAVVKMASSETSMSERSQVYILKKRGFKVSQIMEIWKLRLRKEMGD